MKYVPALLATIVLQFAGPTYAGPKTSTVQVDVPAMKCVGCAMSISKSLKKLESVSAVHVDPKSKVAVLEVSSTSAPGEEAIVAAVKSAGYEASNYRSLSDSFAVVKGKLSGED